MLQIISTNKYNFNLAWGTLRGSELCKLNLPVQDPNRVLRIHRTRWSKRSKLYKELLRRNSPFLASGPASWGVSRGRSYGWSRGSFGDFETHEASCIMQSLEELAHRFISFSNLNLQEYVVQKNFV
jgi:hypothetical protein